MHITQHTIEANGRRLYATLHEPEDIRGAILFCAPLFEERKSANRAIVETANGLCADGFQVLRFDYAGCGDSEGDFDSFSLTDWLDDLACAYGFLRDRCPDKPAGIAGLRFGASLAALHAAAGKDCDFTILWEPVLDGGDYIKQELRRSLTREMVTFGKNRQSRADLLADLDSGKPVDLDGYSLSARLYSDLQALDLARIDAAPKPCLVLNVTHRDTLSSGLSRLEETWGPDVAFESVTLQPFWSLVGYIDPAPAIEKTRTWLNTSLPTPTRYTQHATPSPPTPTRDTRHATPAAFENAGRTLRGILHTPADPSGIGVVFLHGWSGCRLGPHRMFVKMARRLTERGCTCLRFDFRGRGESDGSKPEGTIATMVEDTRCATDFLRSKEGVDKIVLLGICSGGKVAIAAAATAEIDALAVWSAETMGRLKSQARNVRKSAFALGTYLRKLTYPQTWRKILTFNVNTTMVAKAMLKHETSSDEEIRQENVWLDEFKSFQGPILFIYGANDPDTDVAARNYAAFCKQHTGPSEFFEIPEANHSFYSLAWEQEVIKITEKWVQRVQESAARRRHGSPRIRSWDGQRAL